MNGPFPVSCLRCRNVYRWTADTAERGLSDLCPDCATWTADDDAMVEASANTMQEQFAVLGFRLRHIGRQVVREWRAGWARGRARSGPSESKQAKRRQA